MSLISSFLKPAFNDAAALILRLGFGLTMLLGHGLGKLSGFADRMDSFPDPLGVGSPVSLGLTVFSEFFCALGVTVGLFTRAAVIPLIVTMVVAAFVIHGNDPFAKQEKAILFLIGYVAIFLAGPGKYAVDSRFK